MIVALIGLAAADVESRGPSPTTTSAPASGAAVGPADHARDPFALLEPDVEDLLPGVVRVDGRDGGKIALGLDAEPV